MAVIDANGQNDWRKLDHIRKGDLILVILEETALAKKANFGDWVPLGLYQASRDVAVEWRLSSCIHEKSRMRILVSMRHVDALEDFKEVRYEWFNDGASKIDVAHGLKSETVGSYGLPQYISKETAVEIRRLSVFHSSSLEALKIKTSISKTAVFWDWNDLEITKL